MQSSAVLSACRQYRYSLTRSWGSCASTKHVVFIGLNPSTADETEDDPTIRRCITYARSWGYDGLTMLNFFAFRATDPKVMFAALNPVGPDNDKTITSICAGAPLVICAWGNGGGHLSRSDEVIKMLPAPHCLTKTKQGEPGHPLYLSKDLKPIPLA